MFFLAVASSALVYIYFPYYRDRRVEDEEAGRGDIFTKMKPKTRIRLKPRFKALLGRIEVAVSLPVSVCSRLRSPMLTCPQLLTDETTAESSITERSVAATSDTRSQTISATATLPAAIEASAEHNEVQIDEDLTSETPTDAITDVEPVEDPAIPPPVAVDTIYITDYRWVTDFGLGWEHIHIPDLLVSAPSTPVLVDDESTPSVYSDEEDDLLVTPTIPDVEVEHLQVIEFDESRDRAEILMQHKLLGEIGVFLAPAPSRTSKVSARPSKYVSSLEPILELVESSDDLADLASEDSAPDVLSLLADLGVTEDTPAFAASSEDTINTSVAVSEPATPAFESDAPQHLEVPSVCFTQTERDAAVEDSRYPRFIATKLTFKRSALKAPVKVNWKKGIKRTLSLPNFLAGVAVSGSKKITEAAKGRNPFAKRARRDVAYIFPGPGVADGGKDVKRSSTARF